MAEALVPDGLPLTAATATAHATVAAAETAFPEDRDRAIDVLAEIDPDKGAALRLRMAIDGDFDDDERVEAMRRLRRISPEMTAALEYLMWMTDLGRLSGLYKAEANELVTGNELDERAYVAGLEIILANEYLEDRYRAEAGAMLIRSNGRQGYQMLKEVMRNDLIPALAEALPAGSSAVYSALWWIVENAELPSEERFEAAEALATEDPQAGAQALRILAEDRTLDAQARGKAVQRAAELDSE